MEAILESLSVFSQPAAWVSLLTLASLEIVLGIDNIVFITILASRVPREKQVSTRRLGLAVALISRIALLASLSWVTKMTNPLFSLMGKAVSVRDLILILGGLFLIAKATVEIYRKVELAHEEHGHSADSPKGRANLRSILIQIMLIDIVFSLDSVITAVGMVDHLSIMVIAVLIAVAVMMLFAGAIGDFIERRPSVKILALSFLVMIGVLLVAEGFGEHVNKGYVYFGMAFSLLIEMLNMRYQNKLQQVTNTLKPT